MMTEIMTPNSGEIGDPATREGVDQSAAAQAPASLSVITRVVPDLEASLDKHDVSFDQLCEAYFGRHDADPDRKSAYLELYPKIQAAYDKKHGTTTTYFTEPRLNLRAGIALSKAKGGDQSNGKGLDQLAMVYDPGLAPSNTL